jgi:hypothetical protein
MKQTNKPSIIEEIDEILGDYKDLILAKANEPFDYKELWHEHLEEKYLGHILPKKQNSEKAEELRNWITDLLTEKLKG